MTAPWFRRMLLAKGKYMRRVSLLVLMLLTSVIVFSQSNVPDDEIGQVRSAIGTLISRSDRAAFLLRDLSDLQGFVVGLEEDSFFLSTTKKKKQGMKILYSEVLVITSKRVSLSLVPDPDLRPYGSWEKVSKLRINTQIAIVQSTGEITAGRYRGCNKEMLQITAIETNQDNSLPRKCIASVYIFRNGRRNVADGISGGTRKGSEIGRNVGSGSGVAFASALGSGIGAFIGAANGVLNKDEGLKVLIFSQ